MPKRQLLNFSNAGLILHARQLATLLDQAYGEHSQKKAAAQTETVANAKNCNIL